jgi:hypothetical protein
MKYEALKNAVYWYVTPCGLRKNRHIGGTYRLHHEADKNRQARNNVNGKKKPKQDEKKLINSSVFPTSPIMNTLMVR